MAIKRITPDKYGLDEVYAEACQVHIERMNQGHIWIGIDCGPDKLRIHFHSTKPIRANLEHEGGEPDAAA